MKKNNRIGYNDILELFDEASAVLVTTLTANRRLENENYYLSQFIIFKGLNNEFEYFKEHAHEADDPDNPFPPLVL